MPENLHSQIRTMSDPKITKIMDMMKIRIRFYKDLANHTYFFEDPDYADDQSLKFAKRLNHSNHVKKEIL